MDDRVWTYGQLAALVDRIAAHLTNAGVARGSRVALSAGNRPEFLATVLATMHVGAAVVMVSTAWRDGEVSHAFALTDPTHLVHDGTGATALEPLTAGRPLLHLDELTSPVGAPPAAAGEPDDVAVMVFSSGTTGMPKAVRHTHRTLGHATDHWIATLGLAASDRLQIATPPFHILGLLNLLAVVGAGASVRLHRRFDLDAVLHAVERDRVTIEMAVAPIALAMASHPDLERFDLSSLRYIMWGATPVTPSVAATVTARCGVPFLPGYGASELPVIAVNPVNRPAEWRLDAVGVAAPEVQLRVVDLDTGAVLGPGEVGELQGRSPSLMVGYLPEAANDDAFVDGWYRTGDVGSVDADGWVTITDRVKEMVKVNGFQVAPAEVEAVLLGHPHVIDCAAFGVPDPRSGEAVVAAVVVAPEATVSDAELMALVADRLASYKRVSAVRFVDQIPRLPSGKVLRRHLQQEMDSV
jgi:acyl-CoA synthetase (AMP-forming)/AMP-acid ligase II